MFLACECGRLYRPKGNSNCCRECEKHRAFLVRKNKSPQVKRDREQQGKKPVWKKANICLWCALVFTIKTRSSRNDGKYCSRQCRFDYLAWRTETRKVQTEGDVWIVGKTRFCGMCQKLFVASNSKGRFCSSECQYQSQLVSIRIMECRQCGTSFEGKGQPVCSECVRRNKLELRQQSRKTRGRCKKYGTIYTPGIKREDIFDRDEWTCKLCGIECRRDGNYLEDDAPELDHIIAISKGGNHEEENLMCLCRRCNGVKHNKSLSDVIDLMSGQKATTQDQKITPAPTLWQA